MAAVKRTTGDYSGSQHQTDSGTEHPEQSEDSAAAEEMNQQDLDTFDKAVSQSVTPEFSFDSSSDGDGPIELALQQFVQALKHEFARQRQRERDAVRAAFTEQVRKIEIEARKVLRERVIEARNREQKNVAEREKRINGLFRKLNLLARDIAHQKQVLKKSREEFDRKLLESDFIQTELRNIGHQMGEQVDSLGDSLLEEGFIEETMPERKAG